MVTERNKASYLCNNHFCFLWKSEGASFNQAIQELKTKFKIFDNNITEANVNSHFIFAFMKNKFESHLTIFIVYDLETHFTDGARPYNMKFFGLNT